ncbi:MAG TPA: alanine racemase [Myxococcales bacterium]|nr:alanine racemase [Myxococcales bacterium]HIK86625.1 alanine racemase [Myxococcales bacterium]
MHDSGEDRPAWAWIDRDALRHNARHAIACADGRAVIGVVKADAYGHGIAEIARGLLAEGISRLAVISVGEGAELRRAGIVAPVLLLGGLTDAAAAERALKWGLTPVLHDQRGFELLRAIGHSGSPLSVEVEIDTGMHRMGVAPTDAHALLQQIVDTPQLSLSGLFTHLAQADEADLRPTRDQVAQFVELGRRFQGAVGAASDSPALHVANSAGLFRMGEIEPKGGELTTSAVRPGLMLYGVSPFSEKSAESLDLDPVMTLAARVVALRSVAKGDGVGYGGDWRATRETRVATLPIGYADGLPRSLAGRGRVYLAGAMRSIVGRVSMDYVTVDVGPSGGAADVGAEAVSAVELGQIATVFGRTGGGKRVPIEDLAVAAGTIGYEILVGIGNRVPRYAGNGLPPYMDPHPLTPAV